MWVQKSGTSGVYVLRASLVRDLLNAAEKLWEECNSRSWLASREDFNYGFSKITFCWSKQQSWYIISRRGGNPMGASTVGIQASSLCTSLIRRQSNRMQPKSVSDLRTRCSILVQLSINIYVPKFSLNQAMSLRFDTPAQLRKRDDLRQFQAVVNDSINPMGIH